MSSASTCSFRWVCVCVCVLVADLRGRGTSESTQDIVNGMSVQPPLTLPTTGCSWIGCDLLVSLSPCGSWVPKLCTRCTVGIERGWLCVHVCGEGRGGFTPSQQLKGLQTSVTTRAVSTNTIFKKFMTLDLANPPRPPLATSSFAGRRKGVGECEGS